MAESKGTGGVRGQLKCAICRETYKNPKLLHCMHTFCEECIYKKSKENEHNKVTCPTCCYETTIGEDQLLWKNHIIEKSIEKEKLAVMKTSGMFYCSECEKDIANYFCVDCKLKLCDKCSSHHKRCSRYNGHTIKRMEDIPDEQMLEVTVVNCPRHGKMLKYFCDTCQTSSCSDCALSKVHQNHSFRLMDEIIEAEVESLKELIPLCRLKGKEYEAYLSKVADFIRIEAEAKKTSIKVINDVFDALISSLITEKENLKVWINEAYDSSADSFKRANDELKIIAPTTKYLEEVLEYPGEEVFDVVSEGKKKLSEIVKNIDAVTKQVGTDPQNVFDVNASSRSVVTGPYLEMIQTAMKQVSFLQQSTTPIPIKPCQGNTYNNQLGYNQLGFNQLGNYNDELDMMGFGGMSTRKNNNPPHNSTYLPDSTHYLPPGIYLPHAFTSSEKQFQKIPPVTMKQAGRRVMLKGFR